METGQGEVDGFTHRVKKHGHIWAQL